MQVLPKIPSFGEQFAEALGGGLSKGLGSSIDTIVKQLASRSKSISKNKATLSPFISKELKARGLKSYAEDPKYLEDLRNKMLPLIEEGYDPTEAFEYARQESQSEQEAQPQSSGFGDFFKSLGGERMQEASARGQELKSKRSDRLQEARARGQALKAKGSPFAPSGRALLENPVKALGSAGLGAVAPFEEAVRYQSPAAKQFVEQLGFTNYQKEKPKLLSEMAREKLREGSKEEQGHEQLELLGSLAPIGTLFSKLLGGGKKAAQALGLISKGTEAKAAPATAKSLAGRASAATKTPTEMRVSRAAPERRLFPTKPAIEKREAQLKAFPKYEAEIAEDAAKREAQALARTPKTEKGLASQEARIVEAKKQLPAAQESFAKSSARVRALENEVAAYKGPEKERVDSLLKMAKEDLKDAELDLMGRLENTKGINYRATAEEMRTAARDKVLKISDTLRAGEEYKLPLVDYNPEHIKEAKRLSKKKPIPRTREEDFYTRTHDRYINEYRNRLGKVEEDLKKIPKSIYAAEDIRNLQKEKDILQKMINSAEAENTIHRHKFALREISERHKAKERIAAFKKVQENPKVREAAQKSIWKERVKELKSPEGRAKVANDISEEAAASAKSPEQAEKIRSQKLNLKEHLDEFINGKEELAEALKTTSTPKEAKETSEKIIGNFKGLIDFIKKFGKNAAVGVGSAAWDDFAKEHDIPLKGASLVTTIFGRGGLKGAGYRFIINQLTKHLLKKWHISNAAKAYREHNDEKLRHFSPAIKKKAREKAFG